MQWRRLVSQLKANNDTAIVVKGVEPHARAILAVS